MTVKHWKIIIPVVLVLAVVGYGVFFLLQNPNNLNRHYSLKDFRQVAGESQYQDHVDKLNKDFETLRAGVANQVEEYDLWIDIGIRKQALKDFGGAKAAWEMDLKINPKNALAIANLANLYKSFIPDYAKSEEFYLRAISLNVTAEPYFPDYDGLADLYLNYLKEGERVETLMLSGLEKAFSKDTRLSFYVYLTNFFRESDQAKYEQYRSEALKLDSSLKGQL